MDERQFTSSTYLEQIVAKGCLTRLLLLGCLVLLNGTDWTGLPVFQDRFVLFQGQVFTGFLVLGFSLNILYLLLWKRFSSIYLFFRFQLVSDLTLAGCWILLSGGVSSGFIFLFLIIAFFYGRIFGFRATVLNCLVMILFLAGVGGWQFSYPELWGQMGYASGYLLYNISLQALALALVCMLALVGSRQEQDLAGALFRKEQALAMAEQLKGHILDWMDSGLLLLEDDGTIAAMNRRALEWAGVARADEVIGLHLGKVFPEIDDFRRSHPNKEIRREVLACKVMGGVFGIKVTFVPEARRTLILFSDITPYVALEERVRTMEKLASIGELAAGLAHEIKNPLAGIKASLQLLAGDDLAPEYTDRLQQVIIRDIDRLDVLLKDFLAYANPSPGERESVDPFEVVQEVVATLEPAYPDVDMVLQDVDDAETPWIWDRRQLYQVVYNLVLNGVQIAQSEVVIRRIGHGLGLEVRDDGPGLDASVRTRLFEPFVTTREQGTGLGLAVALRLATSNGYFIELRNRDDGPGAVARVLPLSDHPDAGTDGQ